jgi:hypothetical protein
MVDNDPASGCGRVAILHDSSRPLELTVASPQPVRRKSIWLIKRSGRCTVAPLAVLECRPGGQGSAVEQKVKVGNSGDV